ncbi:hypothetical protein F511_26925 [Dorcoceras hygrometricum]|uniref:Splicing factor 3B subunit 1-like n=1 Tax=Dorcoceras hygrometricum TaxID=472368 RepID=A0A2Z7BQ49_9LAMI|nr:hypothetical protein F511_26925 [Dorcoceras hygrometricum]
MVTKSSKQAKGFAAQICVLLKGAPDLTLGESKTFPPLKILTVKTVGTYIAKNKSVSTSAEEVVDELAAEKVVKAAAKRKPASIAESASKKKRTTVGRAAPTEKTLVLVPVVTDSVILAESPTVQRRQASKRKLILQELDDEQDEMEMVAEVLSNEEGPLVETEKDEEIEKEATDKGKKVAEEKDSKDTEPLRKVLKLTETSVSDEESMSIDDLLHKIPEDMMLPSVTAEIREAVVEEISSLFYSFSVCSLYALTSISDLAEKEEQPVGTYNMCRDLVVVDIDLETEMIPAGIFDAFQHGLHADGFVDFFVQPEIQYISSSSSSESSVPIRPRSARVISSSSSSSASRMNFTDEIPQTSQIAIPTVVLPTDFTDSISQLRASIDQIRLEQLSTLDSIDELKAALSGKNFDAFQHGLHADDEIPQTSQIAIPTVVLPTDFTDSISQLRASIDQIRLEQLSTLDSIDELKAALSGKITGLEMGFAQASSHKEMGEESSRGPPPDDRSRPSGGGSSSEPSRKRGGSYKGRGNRSSGWNRWFS